MKHFIEIEPDQEITSPMLTEDKTTFSAGDELVVTVKGHREQAILNITSVNRERVFKGWVYLGLTGIDDIKDLFTRNASQQGEQC